MDRDIKKRIMEAVRLLCEDNKSEFCRRIGRKPDAIKDIIGGKGTMPSFDLIYDILSSDMGISPRWLVLGEGSMLTRDAEPQPPQNNIHHNQQVVISNIDIFSNALATAFAQAIRQIAKEQII